ncbi:MAG: thiamin-monophosphate kinase, partial [Pseudomonadota bacterium]
MSEFNLIKEYFTRPSKNADLGAGDDAALVSVSPGHQLAISTDMSVAGTHFFNDCPPYFIGWKSLAVNISDMAAMGASPKWATLAIAIPNTDKDWLSEFSRGFFACADAFDVSLIGGDTTRGPLNISVQIMGEIPNEKALRRDGAKVADEVWVSGSLGAAALAVHKTQQNSLDPKKPSDQSLLEKLQHPQPRISLGLALRGIANSAIDLSDGLLADLGHILDSSKLGATIDWSKIPHFESAAEHLSIETIQSFALTGGDDYELCFTAPSNRHSDIINIGKSLGIPLSQV